MSVQMRSMALNPSSAPSSGPSMSYYPTVSKSDSIGRDPGGSAADDAYRRSLSRLSSLLQKHRNATSDAGRHGASYLNLSRTLSNLVVHDVPEFGAADASPPNSSAALAESVTARGATYRLTSAVTSLSSTVYELEAIQSKFDAVRDCGPSIARLVEGQRVRSSHRDPPVEPPADPPSEPPPPEDPALRALDAASRSPGMEASLAAAAAGVGALTERDVYSAADAMEVLRDAHSYFMAGREEHGRFVSAPSAVAELQRVHRSGVEAMCGLVAGHLSEAGAAIRMKKGARIAGLEGPDDMVDASSSSKNKTISFQETPLSPASSHQRSSVIHHDPSSEPASLARRRLSSGLTSRDLMKSVGEYEEKMALDTRAVRELRAIFECLAGGSHALVGDTPIPTEETTQFQEDKACRTERVGGNTFTKLARKPINTSYPHIDAFATARREVVEKAMTNYYKALRTERKKRRQKNVLSGMSPVNAHIGTQPQPTHQDWTDTYITSPTNINSSPTNTNHASNQDTEAECAARDAVRCLEHSMVVIQGERSIYRTIFGGRGDYSSASTDGASVGSRRSVAASLSSVLEYKPMEAQDALATYRRALLSMYSHIVSSVVDRAMDIIETAFLRECASTPDAALGEGKTDQFVLPVGEAASAVAAALRIVDGVRMLGPSLSKLCDVSAYGVAGGAPPPVRGDPNHAVPTIAGSLCISLHRMTVKCCARAMENLGRAVSRQGMSPDGTVAVGPSIIRESAAVAMISSDVVRAVRILAPFTNAYNSVSKRKQFTWDDQIGDKSGGMDRFVRYVLIKLLQNLQAKSKQCIKNEGAAAELKCHIFLINNAEYLYELIGPDSGPLNTQDVTPDDEPYEITGTWFQDTVGQLRDREKKRYLEQTWFPLLKHLTSVDKNELSYQNESSRLLTLDSGRLIKDRFKGFADEFEQVLRSHRGLQVHSSLGRRRMIADIKQVFMPRYTRFFDKYSKIKFSKRKQEEYLKFDPPKVDSLVDNLFKGFDEFGVGADF